MIERILARFTDRVITVSDSLKKQLSDVYRIAPSEKIEVVRLGFDLTELGSVAQSDRRASRKNIRPLVIGWVGRFTEIKDPLLFVELACSMKVSGLTAKFVMVGDGALRYAVEQSISKQGLSSDFVLTGWQRNMPHIYSGMDLMVSTSINEGTPVTLIEAMATGCPFVAPNVGGLVDLTAGLPERREGFSVYSNGILVSSRNAESLTQAVSLLLTNSQLRERMGETAHRLALENFGQDRLIREMESLYSRFLQNKSPALRGNFNTTLKKE